MNHLIEGIEVDFFFPEAHLIVEVDGARYHDTAFARRNDADNQARLEAAGFRVLRVTWGQIARRPTQTARRLRRALITSGSASYAAAP